MFFNKEIRVGKEFGCSVCFSPKNKVPKEDDADQFLPKVAIHPCSLLEDQLTCLFVTLSPDLMLFFFSKKCSCSMRNTGLDTVVTERISWLACRQARLQALGGYYQFSQARAPGVGTALHVCQRLSQPDFAAHTLLTLPLLPAKSFAVSLGFSESFPDKPRMSYISAIWYDQHFSPISGAFSIIPPLLQSSIFCQGEETETSSSVLGQAWIFKVRNTQRNLKKNQSNQVHQQFILLVLWNLSQNGTQWKGHMSSKGFSLNYIQTSV